MDENVSQQLFSNWKNCCGNSIGERTGQTLRQKHTKGEEKKKKLEWETQNKLTTTRCTSKEEGRTTPQKEGKAASPTRRRRESSTIQTRWRKAGPPNGGNPAAPLNRRGQKATPPKSKTTALNKRRRDRNSTRSRTAKIGQWRGKAAPPTQQNTCFEKRIQLKRFLWTRSPPQEHEGLRLVFPSSLRDFLPWRKSESKSIHRMSRRKKWRCFLLSNSARFSTLIWWHDASCGISGSDTLTMKKCFSTVVFFDTPMVRVTTKKCRRHSECDKQILTATASTENDNVSSAGKGKNTCHQWQDTVAQSFSDIIEMSFPISFSQHLLKKLKNKDVCEIDITCAWNKNMILKIEFNSVYSSERATSQQRTRRSISFRHFFLCSLCDFLLWRTCESKIVHKHLCEKLSEWKLTDGRRINWILLHLIRFNSILFWGNQIQFKCLWTCSSEWPHVFVCARVCSSTRAYRDVHPVYAQQDSVCQSDETWTPELLQGPYNHSAIKSARLHQ